MNVSLNRSIVYYIYFVFSVVFVRLTNDKWQYIPMLVVMYVSPLLLLTKISKIQKEDIILFGIILMMMSSAVLHPQLFRWSSFLYSCMFIMTYLYFTKALVDSRINQEKLIVFFSYVITAYAVVLFIQQISVVLGLPVFNESYNGENETTLKQGALSIEASNTGPILTVLMYAIIKLRENIIGKKYRLNTFLKDNKHLFIFYSYVCIGSLSVTCLLSYFTFYLYFLKKRNILIALISISLLISLLSLLIPEVYERVSVLLKVLFSFDPYLIYETDSSSSARIAPYLFYFMEMNPLDSNFWLGHGMDYGGLHVFGSLVGNDVENNAGMGGIINFLYDFGMLNGILYFWFVIRLCTFKSYSFLLYLLLFSQITFNHYMLWLFFMMIFTIKTYTSKY